MSYSAIGVDELCRIMVVRVIAISDERQELAGFQVRQFNTSPDPAVMTVPGITRSR